MWAYGFKYHFLLIQSEVNIIQVFALVSCNVASLDCTMLCFNVGRSYYSW
jgi:hypothetical protein